MRGFSAFAALALLSAAPAAADPADAAAEQARVAAAVEGFMAAFNAKDADAMASQSIAGATVTVIEEQDGEDRLRTQPLETLISGISATGSDIAEPIWDMRVMQEGPVATVVANFDFLINGVRSHCGTNVFNLVRVEGEWKIAGIAYSHIEEGCLGAPEQ
ncbi:nuclear transport factor 2 family protein [Erythrobacter rubeus]|uniref:Nuclear transport factor 2 family protein n=1 Tax=Erythrobacter rubeus TaxID=2760803 RepID=A0ABR8KR11_9SPHN|nr:nuclear transport factor 2 family protein [Erythrobacter rubeus]MBD2840874.1 nuclear transport factor 2 family protein [Erythrobacter rubeus]